MVTVRSRPSIVPNVCPVVRPCFRTAVPNTGATVPASRPMFMTRGLVARVGLVDTAASTGYPEQLYFVARHAAAIVPIALSGQLPPSGRPGCVIESDLLHEESTQST